MGSRTVVGVSSLAPSAIHFLTMSTSAAEERVVVLGHGGRLAAVLASVICSTMKLLSGWPGDDAGLLVVAGLEQVGVVGHDEAAERLGGLVAALAVLLEEAAHVAVVADVGRFLGLVGGRRRSAAQIVGARNASTAPAKTSGRTQLMESTSSRNPGITGRRRAGGWAFDVYHLRKRDGRMQELF